MNIANPFASATAAQVDVLTNLSKRRGELDARQSQIQIEANILAATESRVDSKIGQLKALQSQIAALLEEHGNPVADLLGAGNQIAAALIAHAGDVRRFRDADPNRFSLQIALCIEPSLSTVFLRLPPTCRISAAGGPAFSFLHQCQSPHRVVPIGVEVLIRVQTIPKCNLAGIPSRADLFQHGAGIRGPDELVSQDQQLRSRS